MTNELFEVEKFLSLSRDELAEYVEPLLAKDEPQFPESAFDALNGRLGEFDIEHRVYALEVCMRIKPDDFKDVLIEHLADSNSSVCCTAFNLLDRLDAGGLNENQQAKLRSVEPTPLVTADVRTGAERKVGSNRAFLDQLHAKFLSANRES